MPGSDTSFEGSIPVLYHRHLAPLLFEPYAIDIAMRIAALAPPLLLETAAGTGSSPVSSNGCSAGGPPSRLRT